MILTFYIFRQTLSNVVIATLVFVGIIWLSQSFKTMKLIINKGPKACNLNELIYLQGGKMCQKLAYLSDWKQKSA